MKYFNKRRDLRSQVIWNAKWIHAGVTGDGVHYAWFFKEIEVTGELCSARLHVTADKSYKLFIDDAFIGRGPLPSNKDYWSYDSYKVDKHLPEGTHIVRILVQQKNPGDYYKGERPLALLCQLELCYLGGTCMSIGSDSSWSACRDAGWAAETPKSFYDLEGMEFIEVFNAAGSTGESCESLIRGGHGSAQVFRRNTWITELYNKDEEVPHLGKLWKLLVPRDLPFLDESCRFKAEIIKYGEVEPGNVDKHAYKFAPQIWQGINDILEPLHAEIRGLEQINGFDGGAAVLKPAMASEYPHRIYYPAFILDFGEVVNGYIRLEAEGEAGSIIDISYAQALCDGRVFAVSGHNYRVKRYILKEGRQPWESYEYVNCRYVQVTVRTPTPPAFYIREFAPLKIYSVGIREVRYPVGRIAAFACSDEKLARLFEASARSVLLCANDRIMDNSYREKHNWSGDICATILSLIAVYGNMDIIKRYFRTFLYEQYPSGMFSMITPGSNDLLFDHAFAIPIRLAEYCHLTGDSGLAEELYPGVIRFFEFLERYERDDGILGYIPWDIWFDWSNLNRTGSMSTINFYYLRALIAGRCLAQAAGADGDAATFSEKIENLKLRLSEIFWNDDIGAFAEYIDDAGRQSSSVCEHANGLALYCGACSGMQRERILKNVFGKGLGLDENRGIIKTGPPFQVNVLQGLCAVGRTDLVLEFFRKRSFKWIEAGFDTVPEVWDIDLRTHDSLAQAPASEAFVILTEFLGIKPLKDGFKAFRLAPKVCGLDWAEGSVPWNGDMISVRWEKDGKALHVSLEKPPETDCYFTAPEGFRIARGVGIDASGDAEGARLSSFERRISKAEKAELWLEQIT